MMKVDFIDLTITITPPVDCTKAEADEWIAFQITGGSMSAKNPLADYELKDFISISSANFLQYKTRFAESSSVGKECIRLSELQPGDEFQYINGDEWHKVSRIDDLKIYYPGGINEQTNWRVDDVLVRVKPREEVSNA